MIFDLACNRGALDFVPLQKRATEWRVFSQDLLSSHAARGGRIRIVSAVDLLIY